MQRIENRLEQLGRGLRANVMTEGVAHSVHQKAKRVTRTRLMRPPALVIAVALVVAAGTLGVIELFGGTSAGPSSMHSPENQSSGGLIGQVSGRFAFAAWDGSGIYVLTPGGSSPTRVTQTGGQAGLSWSPDGSKIVFAQGISEGNGALVVVNTDGGGPVTLTDAKVPQHPDWSPDGREVAYTTSRGDLYRINSDGTGRPMRVTSTNSACDDLHPDWSPDGSRLAFERDCPSGGLAGVYVVNLDGTGLGQILPVPDATDGLSWSPDGTAIAFTRSSDGVRGIYVMQADGLGLRRLTDSLDQFPAWSLDGNEIAFVRDGQIWETSASFTEETQVSNLADIRVGAFSWTDR